MVSKKGSAVPPLERRIWLWSGWPDSLFEKGRFAYSNYRVCTILTLFFTQQKPVPKICAPNNRNQKPKLKRKTHRSVKVTVCFHSGIRITLILSSLQAHVCRFMMENQKKSHQEALFVQKVIMPEKRSSTAWPRNPSDSTSYTSVVWKMTLPEATVAHLYKRKKRVAQNALDES
ncbi:unnamed protein product, partial [Ixodes pacificus]